MGCGIPLAENIRCIDPLGYIDMLHLMKHAKKILTDSGGIQKEAYVMGVPCITLRENTEWLETLTGGWNVLVGADKHKILAAILADVRTSADNTVFGKGDQQKKIVRAVKRDQDNKTATDLLIKSINDIFNNGIPC